MWIPSDDRPDSRSKSMSRSQRAVSTVNRAPVMTSFSSEGSKGPSGGGFRQRVYDEWGEYHTAATCVRNPPLVVYRTTFEYGINNLLTHIVGKRHSYGLERRKELTPYCICRNASRVSAVPLLTVRFTQHRPSLPPAQAPRLAVLMESGDHGRAGCKQGHFRDRVCMFC